MALRHKCVIASTIVWEWLNVDTNCWVPYEPHISGFLERHCRPNIGIKSVNIVIPLEGNLTITARYPIENALTELTVEHRIDYTKMTSQRSIGSVCPVRRQIYPAGSPASHDISWQWSGDWPGHWHAYSMEHAQTLEDAYLTKQTSVKIALGSATYTVSLQTMVQVRSGSSFKRSVDRVNIIEGYKKMITTTAALLTRPMSPTVLPETGESVDTVKRKRMKTTVHSKMPFTTVQAASTFSTPSLVGGHLPNLVLSNSISLTSSASSLGAPISSGRATTNAQPLPPSAHTSQFNSVSLILIQAITGGSTSAAPSIQQAAKGQVTVKPRSGSEQSAHEMECIIMQDAEKYTSSEEVLDNYIRVPSILPVPDEKCIICLAELCENSIHKKGYTANVCQLMKCKHLFHRSCLVTMYQSGTKDGSLQCPVCKALHGVKHGVCPDGSMVMQIINYALPGYPLCKALKVTYDIKSGIQGAHHPNPGVRFRASSFPRTGYLPNNEDGRKILGLLVTAWKRRLTFTIGTSVTTGKSNVVVWNEIHHKTEPSGNHSGHGFPDPNYMKNVLAELAAHGVTDDQPDDRPAGSADHK